MDLGPLYNEISQHLGFDGHSGGIRNALTHQLEFPLRDSSCGIPILDDFAEREGCHDRHWVQLEVVMQLSPGDQDGIQELLDLGVASLGIGQDFANEVYGMLHLEGVSCFFLFYHQGSADHLHGGRKVKQEWFPIGWWDQNRSFRKDFLDLVKCLLSLGCPHKSVSFL